MSETLAPFVWVAIVLPMLVVVQRWVHRHLHGVSLLLTGKASWAMILYAIVLLPGVFLHEFSHWLVAGMLGVRTGRFSIIPRSQPDGSVQLGYVEVYRSRTLDPIRESLIGGAPLIFGTAAILAVAFYVFDLTGLAPAIASGRLGDLTGALGQILSASDFLVWLYLLFAISNAMLPSPSDRRAWPAFLLLLAVAAAITLLLGLQDRLWQGIAQPAAVLFGYLGVAFSLALGVDLCFMVGIALVERILTRARRVELIYGQAPGTVSEHHDG